MRDKRQKFVELAEKRVNNALKQIELIGNLANRANYDYEDSDYQTIFRVIDAEVREMKRKFSESNSSTKRKFSLSRGE